MVTPLCIITKRVTIIAGTRYMWCRLIQTLQRLLQRDDAFIPKVPAKPFPFTTDTELSLQATVQN